MYTTDELVLHVQEETLRDFANPVLFSESGLRRYMQEAFHLFCRHTHYFTELREFFLVAGERCHTLPANTLHIRQVFYPESGVYLTPFTRRAKPAAFIGRPQAYSTDSAQRVLRVYPAPDVDYIVELDRAYIPTLNCSTNVEIGLPDDYCLLLGDWMAYRALNNNDPDGSQTVSAELFRAKWASDLRDAKVEVIRRAMGDNPSAQPRKWT